jgi:DedD protein
MFKVGNMQRETAGDVELNLKKRARRRLVGAIALVLLMVIVLPMILKDRAATAPHEQVTITLPSEQTAPAVSDFDSNIVPTDPPITLTPEVAEPEAESTAIADPEAAPAKEAPAKEPVVAKPSSGKFYVQIGVFSDAANVKQLQAKLSDLGYKSQTEKINTDKGQKIRLKTQVFGDRNEAAIALENIKDAGLTGMVVSQ